MKTYIRHRCIYKPLEERPFELEVQDMLTHENITYLYASSLEELQEEFSKFLEENKDKYALIGEENNVH